jgi:NAD(P)-dependent dehydrogenase (short-subunit alcohol dehydrogenase family)
VGRLEGRVAIVTGGGNGIGRGIARRFAAEGAAVLVADIDGGSAEGVAGELAEDFGAASDSMTVDVAVKAQVLAMVEAARETWGAIDILVNNAWGGEVVCGVEDKSDEQMAHGFGVAYYGPLWAMQAAYPTMKERRWGRIVNLCSAAGVNAYVGTVDYNAAKEALRTLTRTAAREWAPYGVVANVICPGAKSGSLRPLLEERPELEPRIASLVPMQRLGDPEADIGPVAVFLASEDARYVTGNTLFVDGGGHIGGVQWDARISHPEGGAAS